MNFTIEKSLDILERTPKTLTTLLQGISEEWTSHNEGGETWSVYDIIGHLIHGEKTDWIPRAEIILSENSDKNFQPFDRFAQLEAVEKKAISQLLKTFEILRKKNVKTLKSYHLTEKDLVKTGIHPAFGEVTLLQLLSTWAVHDLNHLAQIARVMAFQYKINVGPWVAYLGVLNNKK